MLGAVTHALQHGGVPWTCEVFSHRKVTFCHMQPGAFKRLLLALEADSTSVSDSPVKAMYGTVQRIVCASIDLAEQRPLLAACRGSDAGKHLSM